MPRKADIVFEARAKIDSQGIELIHPTKRVFFGLFPKALGTLLHIIKGIDKIHNNNIVLIKIRIKSGICKQCGKIRKRFGAYANICNSCASTNYKKKRLVKKLDTKKKRIKKRKAKQKM